jgi:tripartite-type tricarboxylate transporter receptor subunit TctC
MKRTMWFYWCAAMLACASMAGTAVAQGYPAKPIRIITGSLQGTTGEIALRLVAPKLGASLGQPVIVDNRPGANGIVAAMAVVRSDADGYNFAYLTAGTLVLASYLTKDLPFDSRKDFSPVSIAVQTPTFFLINASVPVNSLRELIEYTKRNPGKFAYGSAGVGSIPHFLGETFRMTSGADMFAVQYSAGGVQQMIPMSSPGASRPGSPPTRTSGSILRPERSR